MNCRRLAIIGLTISVGLGLCQNHHAMCRSTSNCDAEPIVGHCRFRFDAQLENRALFCQRLYILIQSLVLLNYAI